MVVNSYDSSLMADSVNEYNLNISSYDKEIQGSESTGTFTELQKIINDAPENSTINLEKNYK
jgi:hypothetical protein